MSIGGRVSLQKAPVLPGAGGVSCYFGDKVAASASYKLKQSLVGGRWQGYLGFPLRPFSARARVLAGERKVSTSP